MGLGIIMEKQETKMKSVLLDLDLWCWCEAHDLYVCKYRNIVIFDVCAYTHMSQF